MISLRIVYKKKSLLSKMSEIFDKMSIHSGSKNATVAVCQMTSGQDKDKNFNCVENLVKSAAERNASMIFLPEACDYICENARDTVKYSESKDENLIPKYRNLARQYNVWLSLGGVHQKFTDEKAYNTHLVINSEGNIVGEYNKVHTFDVELAIRSISESSYVEKGKSIVPPVKTPVGNVGLAVCYDIRFPEIGIALTEMGADILTYPSAFMHETGSLHWETLLRSRAIENQCYVIAAAQTGYPFPNRRLWGHAMIVDPYGTVCAQCSEGTGIAVATIDKELIGKARSTMPLLFQKRFDVYPRLGAPVTDNEAGTYQFGQVVIKAETVFYKTSLTIAVVNRRCAVPGHVLIIPIRVVKRFLELNAVEVADLFQTVQKVQSVMENVHNAKATTVAIQDGPDAGQTINHVHVHILPRKPGDFPDNDDIYRVLQKHDKGVQEWREEEEMIEEAKFLRSFFV